MERARFILFRRPRLYYKAGFAVRYCFACRKGVGTRGKEEGWMGDKKGPRGRRRWDGLLMT
jgi:hypothetical protein